MKTDEIAHTNGVILLQLLPAIDIRDGKCVRLRQGDYAQETIFSDDPVAMAERWVADGASMLHLVDLDGAKAGHPVNTRVIGEIVRRAGVPCQLGGGLRTDSGIAEALDLGIARAIIGTQAVRDPGWFRQAAARHPGQLVLGVDAKNGQVATEGWLDVSQVTAIEVASWYRDSPLAAIVYTDIAKDGMMSGPNFEMTQELQRSTPHHVVASGGISTQDDVLELARRGISACILGRTLYEGVITLPALLARLRACPG